MIAKQFTVPKQLLKEAECVYQQSRKTWRLGYLNEGGRGEAGEALDPVSENLKRLLTNIFAPFLRKAFLKQKSILLEGNI